MKRVVITGSSGYLGQKLVAQMRGAGATVLGIDVRESTSAEGPNEFVQSDIRDLNLIDAIRKFGPDTVIHAAFIVRPMHDASEMASINLGGTENLIHIVEELQPARFLFFSSATAYGARAENPLPIPDGTAPRPNEDYQYSWEKRKLEELVETTAQKLPQVAVSWVRPSIVGGSGMDNFLSRFVFGIPIVVKLGGVDHPLQFVHEDDVVGAIQAILEADGRGAYNLGPPNWTLTTEIARHTGKWAIPIPFFVGYASAWLAWKVRFWFWETPPSLLAFARYPWVVSPDRLVNEIGYTFAHTSSETMIESAEQQTTAKINEGLKRDRRGERQLPPPAEDQDPPQAST